MDEYICNMKTLGTPRLSMSPMTSGDFTLFVENMLTDSRVVQFYHSYKTMTDVEEIRRKAFSDFWAHFEESRAHGYEIWSVRIKDTDQFIGWSGLVHSELSDKYGGPEIQYMLAGDAHGKGYATEMGAAIMDYAQNELKLDIVIATIDIPNKGSIRVIEKLGFQFDGQIEAYGSSEMYLYSKKRIP